VRTKSKQLDLLGRKTGAGENKIKALGRKTGALLLKFLRLFPKPHLETIWQHLEPRKLSWSIFYL
jgi:hypothetical protein